MTPPVEPSTTARPLQDKDLDEAIAVHRIRQVPGLCQGETGRPSLPQYVAGAEVAFTDRPRIRLPLRSRDVETRDGRFASVYATEEDHQCEGADIPPDCVLV